MAETNADRARRAAWQYRLLPLMGGLLVLSALFFAVMSVTELRDFYRRVAHERFDLAARFERFEEGMDPALRADPDYLRFKVLSLLEADALQRRYQQANATMLARVWTRHLGFSTGMILALVGAAFILGRLREDTTTAELGGGSLKGSLATSSPGIVLAVLGTGLMALTIWVPFGVETRDVNTYLRAAPAASLPPPGRLLPEEIGSSGGGDGAAASDHDPEEQRLFGGSGAGAAGGEDGR